MGANILIPKKIKVGFQERSGTYTGKLAYVIYYDHINKLRKETSWENWRSKDIEPEDYDNEPTTGFVLNKKVGGYQYHYDMRQTYVRVYDPRGFEFEITIPNLLYILENTSSIKGKGLEGEFVYGWDGKELLLVPTSAPEYQEMQNMANTLYTGECIKAKDLILGATYATASGNQYVYMGKSEYWEREMNYRYVVNWRGYHLNPDYDWKYLLDETWEMDITKAPNHYYRNVKKGQRFWFVSVNTPDSRHIESYKTISKKFYSIVNPNVCADFAEYQDFLEHNDNYSPINFSASKIIRLTYEEFQEKAFDIKINAHYNEGYCFKTIAKEGDLTDCFLSRCRKTGQYYKDREYPTDGNFKTLRELYEEIKPVRTEYYLMNGNLYEGKWY